MADPVFPQETVLKALEEQADKILSAAIDFFDENMPTIFNIAGQKVMDDLREAYDNFVAETGKSPVQNLDELNAKYGACMNVLRDVLTESAPRHLEETFTAYTKALPEQISRRDPSTTIG